MTRRWVRVLAAVALAHPASAGEADVVSAEVACNAARVCDFRVSVRHADEGWDHYANGFEVLAPDGSGLGTRVLRHPHVDEQPFTRALAGVRVPEGVAEVRIRARDSQHGLGGEEVVVAIPETP